METLEHAQKRGANILAEYLGGAVTCDAYHMTDPRKDGLGVSTCIELAIKDAAIPREQVLETRPLRFSMSVFSLASVICVRVHCLDYVLQGQGMLRSAISLTVRHPPEHGARVLPETESIFDT
jgi:hypothetical protein